MSRAFSSSSPPAPFPPPPHRRTLSSTLIDETVAAAAALVQKWHPDTASSTCSLFLHASHRAEPSNFLRAAADLHRAMLFFASNASGSDDHGLIIQAQALLQTAMRRLDLELHLLLHHHDHDMIQQGDATTISSMLRAVADAMMAAGYGKECISTFKSRRRAALAGTTSGKYFNYYSQLHKLSWEQVDSKIMPSWLAAAAFAFKSLFATEKELCATVFAGDAAVGEAVFAAIASDQATNLLAVAEAAVARARRAPERLFRVLDVHDTLTQALPAILSVFGDDSGVATRAGVVIAKAGEAARETLAGLEAAIHKEKEASKATAPGGAVHPLTRYVMNYLVFLADYEEALALIYHHQQEEEEADTSSPADYSSTSSSSSWSTSGSIIGRLVLVLQCKLESMAGSYREAALSYLFLANNTQYVASKVRGSSKLQAILGGEEWAEAQTTKARGQLVEVYVRAAWGKVLAAIDMSGAEGVEAAVMEAVAMQDQWVAADDDMAKALRVAATAAVVPKYRMFYRRYGAALRLTPGDITSMIAALFAGAGGGPPAAVTARRQCTKAPQLQQQPEDPNPRRQQQLFTY